MTKAEARETGLKRFFSGKECPRGHVTWRLVSNGTCCDCLRAKADRWASGNADRVREIGRLSAQRVRAANPGEHAAAMRQLRARDPEKARERDKQDYARNIDKLRAYSREYQQKRRQSGAVREATKIYQRLRRAANKQLFSDQARARRLANPDKAKAISDRHYANNKDAFKARARNRKAQVRGAEGRHTKADIQRILIEQNYSCTVCLSDLRQTKYHVDHVVPICKGGSNWPNNLQCLCPPCNLSKSRLDFGEFLLRVKERGLQCAA